MSSRSGKSDRISMGNRFRYFVNNLLIRNPAWQMLALIAISGLIVIIGMLLVRHLTSDTFWWSFTRLVDQGTFVNDNQYDPRVTAVGVLITIGGIMVLSLLIGIFSSKITEQLDALKRGRSPVLEKGHYVVCGSGDRLFEVTRELIKAREEDDIQGKIVIFSESSREAVEEVILQRMGRKSVRKVICRSGSTTDVDSLQLPCFQRCSGFVIVGDDDSRILKTLVAINSIREDNRPVGVCELRNRSRHRIAEMAYEGIHWLPVREIVMRLIVQVCRQPGLSAVYNEILSFQGNEFYITEASGLSGLPFGEIASRIRGGVASGIVINGGMKLNPPSDRILNDGEKLLVLAENSHSFHFLEEPTSRPSLGLVDRGTCRKPLRMLVFSGRSRKFSFMLGLLEAYAMEGADILVAGSIPQEEGDGLTVPVDGSGCGVRYIMTDRTDPDSVENLHPENYDSIMVISGKSRDMSDEDADSQCIVTLLILRNIADRLGEDWGATVVAEIRNPRNRRLATQAGIDDFVISNEVCSMIMAQLVLEPELGRLYAEIFDPSGCEIQLRCLGDYGSETFDALMEEGLAKNEIVLGWLSGTGTQARVMLNPQRHESLPPDDDTRIVVIAER